MIKTYLKTIVKLSPFSNDVTILWDTEKSYNGSKEMENLTFIFNNNTTSIPYYDLITYSHSSILSHFVKETAYNIYSNSEQRKIVENLSSEFKTILSKFIEDVNEYYSPKNRVNRFFKEFDDYIGQTYIRPFEKIFEWLKK
jgi:hypothetical protein